MWLHLRLTVSQDFASAFEHFLKPRCSKYICVFEISTQGVEHYHLHFMYMKTMSTFRQQMLDAYPNLKGNGQYSLSQTKDEAAHDNYVCKGENNETLPVVRYKSSLKYTDAYIEQSHKAFWIKNAELPKLRQKKHSETFMEYVLLQDEITSINTTYDIRIIRKSIYYTVMKCLGQKAKVLDESIVRRIVNGVMNVIMPYKFSEWMYERTFDSCERFDY